ncbi:MarR family winged helix-turn-helix transcriptional regulator [Microbispora sp. ATCC PTA-5024]|uniref:MarR family winged helix-turn-helix transcriptional regulator n=1 Tax=Microbispora sp. ATCC PTA-5024 TaxID=316330 RepID=UPI0003DBAEB8|nr:MarR family transcriptional regulator [Microbispora sp. ATCC PTA-5024]ETK30912.1 MarR family transcriptional regulator [Microbispora sp. ATCC PTA-5024]
MSSGASDMTHHVDGKGTPARLRGVPTRLLAMVAAHADRVVTEGLAREDARKWHYAVLVTLEELGPASQAELSRRTGIYRSDVVAVINELAGRGLVERAPDPADRRRNVITLTPEGRARLRRLDALLAELQDEVLAPLTGPERDRLIELLTLLADHHARSRGRNA